MMAATQATMDDPGAQWLAAMRRGDFSTAWMLSDRALETPRDPFEHHKPRHDQRIWDGTPVHGRRVLIRCYRGLGDTLQLVRFIPMLLERALSVVTWVQPELLPLLSKHPELGEFAAVHDGAPDVPYDVDLEIMELPHALRLSLADVERYAPPYLRADGARAPTPRSRTVGLVWKAGILRPTRSMEARDIGPLASARGIEWHVLQQGVRADSYDARFGAPPASGDILDTARRMMSLDLVITVDTMTAHLAGALGIPVWLMLRRDADWRWMEGTDTSPWYPGMRLFRQRADGDWADVVRRVAGELDRWSSQPRPSRAAGSDV
jgi:hypothetical protein